MLESFGTRGGQLLGAYFLVILAGSLMLIDHETGKNLLTLIIGAILRDMQDGHKP